MGQRSKGIRVLYQSSVMVERIIRDPMGEMVLELRSKSAN